jgi:hypothetical protein
MQISSSYNLPSLTGYTQDAARQAQTPRRPSANPNNTASTASNPAGQAVAAQPRVRPTIQLQPMFDQSLTYRGEQARRTYQNVEMGGEVELMQRLDETA